MYPIEMVKPMQAELSDAGFQELHTAEAVENAIKQDGTTLVVVNSVCGCAARNARPGAKMSLQNDKKPRYELNPKDILGLDKHGNQKDRLTQRIKGAPATDAAVEHFYIRKNNIEYNAENVAEPSDDLPF